MAPAAKPWTWAILGLVGGLLALVGVFLPWVTVGDLSFGGMLTGIYGLLTLIFGILGLVFCVLRKRTMYLLGGIFGILALIFVMMFMALMSTLAAALATVGSSAVGMGFGVYLSLIGAILLTVGGFLGFAKTPKA